MECCAACREPLDPNDRPPVWPCCLARGHSACYGAASTCPACGAPARLRYIDDEIHYSTTRLIWT